MISHNFYDLSLMFVINTWAQECKTGTNLHGGILQIHGFSLAAGNKRHSLINRTWD